MSEFNASILNGIINIQEQLQSYVKTSWEYYDNTWNLIDVNGDVQIIEGKVDEPISYIGIFEKLNETPYTSSSDVADGRNDACWGYPTLDQSQELNGNYSDITNSTRIIEENLKICPNNMEDGKWHKDEYGYYWVSNTPIYPMVISQEGYIDEGCTHTYPQGDIDDDWDVGTVSANLVKSSSSPDDTKWDMSMDGLLTYPQSPAMLTHYNEGDHDEYGQYYEDKYSDVPFYHKQGKILGDTKSATTGMVFEENE